MIPCGRGLLVKGSVASYLGLMFLLLRGLAIQL